MAKHTIADSTRLTGKGRDALYRRIKKGILSAEKDRDGNTVIDTSELVRVFGELRAETEKSDSRSDATVIKLQRDGVASLPKETHNDDTLIQLVAANREIEAYRRQEISMNRELEEHRAREKVYQDVATAHRDAERELRAIIKNQTLMLSDQREVKAPKQAAVEPEEWAVPKSAKKLKKTKKKKGKK